MAELSKPELQMILNRLNHNVEDLLSKALRDNNPSARVHFSAKADGIAYAVDLIGDYFTVETSEDPRAVNLGDRVRI